jgi:hypothetical protein
MQAGAYQNNKHCVETASGFYLDLVDPDPGAIWLQDIASGLSKKCRFSGQCFKFFSVAEHSCMIQDRVDSFDLKCMAILHDAAESYMGDLPRPLKWLLPEYRDVEHRLQKVIYDRFLPPMLINIVLGLDVRTLDNEQLMYEAYHLMPSRGYDWDFTGIVFDASWMSREPYCWEPDRAEVEFLKRCKDLGITERHTGD